MINRLKGKNNQILKQIVEKIKDCLHQYRQIDGKELKEGEQKRGKEDYDDVDDAKLIKLDPRVNLRKLSLYLPRTLRGKRCRKGKEDDDDDIILKKKRKMTAKEIMYQAAKDPKLLRMKPKVSIKRINLGGKAKSVNEGKKYI